VHSFLRPCPRCLHLSSSGAFAIRSTGGCLRWVGWMARRERYPMPICFSTPTSGKKRSCPRKSKARNRRSTTLLAHELGEAPGVPIGDVTEVSRYVEAMTHGLQRLRNGFPLSNRLLREMHEILLATGRGAQKTPGEFRQSQNWIGGTRPGNAAFVPPPPQDVQHCMGELEKYLHSDTPALVKAALAHLQFETIHPFLDGNGRIGRLLITLLLCHEGVLREPLLYSSLCFKQNRQRYYDELNEARESGDFERWLDFFATAIRVSAEQATTTGLRISAVFREDRNRVREMGRQAPTILLVQEALQAKPLATIATLTQSTGFTDPDGDASTGRIAEAGDRA